MADVVDRGSGPVVRSSAGTGPRAELADLSPSPSALFSLLEAAAPRHGRPPERLRPPDDRRPFLLRAPRSLARRDTVCLLPPG